MTEVWKDIEGYEGKYQVSSLGRVKSLDRVIIVANKTSNGNNYIQSRTFKGKVLKQKINQFGYPTVPLSKNGEQKYLFVHTLVTKAFPEICGKYFEGAVVNHKNEIKTDNRAENLEWCTQQYNINYGTGNQRRIETRNKNKSYHYQKEVGQFSLDGVLISVYKSASDTGYCREAIRDCCIGKQNTAYGFKWKYLN